MNIALCYSGQIGAFHKALRQQRSSFLTNDMDIFVYTSDVVSQKNNKTINLPSASDVHEYLIAGKGWRKNTNTYGIVYKIPPDYISKCLKPIERQIVHMKVQKEDLYETLDDWDMSKWEWLRKRQLWKMHQCNEMVKNAGKKYDIVVRSRFEFGPNVKIDIQKIISNAGDIKNKIFMFGGWNCVPPMVFMDEFICDGFAFG